MNPTTETYTELNRAYHYFNEMLFGGLLPNCIITMQRKKDAYGFFRGDTWADAKQETKTDEIALNPDQFRTRAIAEVLSTLAHEMCHLKQHHFGKPSRSGYHNKEWGQMMEDVGLIPSATGMVDDKKTGQRMTHYIVTGGKFDLACTELIKQGFTIPWMALTAGNEKTRKKKAASKTKYSCPSCGLNAWAKPEISLICGECKKKLVT